MSSPATPCTRCASPRVPHEEFATYVRCSNEACPEHEWFRLHPAAIRAPEELCWCGHAHEYHSLVQPYPCDECECESFRPTSFPDPAPAPEPPPIDLAAMDNTELLGWVTSLGFEGMPDTDEAMHALGQIIVIASRRGSYVDNKVLREELASTRSELERVRNWPDAFVGWIGGGYNFRGKFPTNLTELNDDCKEFARSAPLQTPNHVK